MEIVLVQVSVITDPKIGVDTEYFMETTREVIEQALMISNLTPENLASEIIKGDGIFICETMFARREGKDQFITINLDGGKKPYIVDGDFHGEISLWRQQHENFTVKYYNEVGSRINWVFGNPKPKVKGRYLVAYHLVGNGEIHPEIRVDLLYYSPREGWSGLIQNALVIAYARAPYIEAL